MSVCQISTLEVDGILGERSQKRIADKQILFLPKYIAKGFSRILLYLNFDYKSCSAFHTWMKLNSSQN